MKMKAILSLMLTVILVVSAVSVVGAASYTADPAPELTNLMGTFKSKPSAVTLADGVYTFSAKRAGSTDVKIGFESTDVSSRSDAFVGCYVKYSELAKCLRLYVGGTVMVGEVKHLDAQYGSEVANHGNDMVADTWYWYEFPLAPFTSKNVRSCYCSKGNPANQNHKGNFSSEKLSLAALTHVQFQVDNSNLAAGDNATTVQIKNLGIYTRDNSYTITATATTGGTVSGGNTYSSGKEVTLTATPASGYRFKQWTESGTPVAGAEATYKFTAAANRTLVAEFEKIQYTVSVNVTPDGAGSVSGAGTYDPNAAATLTATAASGYRFVGWEESGQSTVTSNPYEITVTANRTLTASFAAIPTHQHSWSPDWTTSSTHHWHECLNTGCDAVADADKNGYGAHRDNGSGVCADCGYPMVVNYTVTASVSGQGGSVTPSSLSVPAGGNAVFTVAPNPGYVVDTVQLDGADALSMLVGNTVTVPNVAAAHTLTVTFKQADYVITWVNADGSTLEVDSANYGEMPAYNGATPILAPTQGLMYVFEGWSPVITPVSGNATYVAVYRSFPILMFQPTKVNFDTRGGDAIPSVTGKIGGTVDLTSYIPTRPGYRFTGWYSDKELTTPITRVRSMGTKTVYAGWEKLPEVKPEEKPAVNPFSDLKSSDPYYDAVMYVYEKGLMGETSDGRFDAKVAGTRGMLITVLWRLSGEPASSFSASMKDVKSDMYYAPAIRWAAEIGILQGDGAGLYSPDEPITREELAALLYRYAQYRGVNTSAGEKTPLKQSDADTVTAYAESAMQWACAEGIFIVREDGRLDPGAGAIRSDIAVMLHRFCLMLEK